MRTITTTSCFVAANVRIQKLFVAALCVTFLSGLSESLVNQAQAVPVTSGLVAHFDAQDNSSIINTSSGVASDGELVSSWNDLVAGLHDATPSSLTAGPT